MLPPSEPCVTWVGPERRYQSKAAEVLAAVGREPAPWAWVTPVCGNAACIEPEHLRVQAALALSYPHGLCIYCGRRASSRDHLLPRTWTGNAYRKYVATVPACGTCNGLLRDTLTWSITERRAICHERIRRHFRKVLRTKDQTAKQLAEYGDVLRQYLTESIEKKREVERMLAWPEDPTYDMRALHKSGIENPWAIGFLIPHDDALAVIVRAAA